MEGSQGTTKNLFIHCGVHKTATSKFQEICYKNRLLLEQSGLLYPVIKNEYEDLFSLQHSIIARSLSAIDTGPAEYFFNTISQFAEHKNCSTVLLSGEDFENILFDPILLKNLIEISSKFGFQKPTLAFTSRDPFEYFCSMYGELSKKRVIIDFKIAGLSAWKTGFFACPSNDSFRLNQHFNNFFAIQAEILIERFSNHHNDLAVIHQPFSSFIEPWPGFGLLSDLVDSSCLKLIKGGEVDLRKNERMSDLEVEKNYVQNFLGLKREESSPEIDYLSQKRLESRRESERLIKSLFEGLNL